jgi:cytochrome c peroxidase
MTQSRIKSAIALSASVLPLLLICADAVALEPIELLGKHIFFDEKLSTPSNKQACASCHDPAKGWVLPESEINRTTVVAPGAAPHALGSIKPPANAYSSFSPPFQFKQAPFLAPWQGGTFWDGRAEGCGATNGSCPAAPLGGQVSETIRKSDSPPSKLAPYSRFLGPMADQALNPFPNDVEQNIREKNVCQVVKTAKYKDMYQNAFGETIDCSPNPKANPAYRTSFKRIAVALSAWQSSVEVNSFSSKRDIALANDPDHKFPLQGLTKEDWSF